MCCAFGGLAVSAGVRNRWPSTAGLRETTHFVLKNNGGLTTVLGSWARALAKPEGSDGLLPLKEGYSQSIGSECHLRDHRQTEALSDVSGLTAKDSHPNSPPSCHLTSS